MDLYGLDWSTERLRAQNEMITDNVKIDNKNAETTIEKLVIIEIVGSSGLLTSFVSHSLVLEDKNLS